MESRRARTPAPKPCISCTVRLPREAPAPSPSLRPGALPAEGSCFLRRLAAPSPLQLAPHPAAGSQSQSRHPHLGRRKCEAPSLARALPEGPAALPSRGSRTGASRPRAPLVKGNLTAPSAREDRCGEAGGEEGTAGAGDAQRPGADAPALASGGTVSGIPDLSDPGDKGHTPSRLAPAPPAGRARSATSPPSLPASASRRG